MKGSAGGPLFGFSLAGVIASLVCFAIGMEEESRTTTVFQQVAVRIEVAAAAVMFGVSCLAIGLANGLNLIQQQLRMLNETNTTRHRP